MVKDSLILPYLYLDRVMDSVILTYYVFGQSVVKDSVILPYLYLDRVMDSVIQVLTYCVFDRVWLRTV